jgi:hypothetical protein
MFLASAKVRTFFSRRASIRAAAMAPPARAVPVISVLLFDMVPSIKDAEGMLTPECAVKVIMPHVSVVSQFE